jgi:uncharacterized lipoprotein NlpE involved in copper resistance
MKKLFVTTLLFVAAHSTIAQTALAEKIAAIPGSYRHSPPCADCTGIQTTLSLDCAADCASGTYLYSEEGLNTINGDKSDGSTGKWVISDTMVADNDKTVIIALTEDNTMSRNYFLLKNGSLEQLNKSKRQIDPPFNILLVKLPPGTILDLR